MAKNILEYLERTARRFPDKTAFSDEFTKVTYRELTDKAKCIGSALLKTKSQNSPWIVYINKCPSCIEAMLGVAYSGNFYTVIDIHTPDDRLQNILSVLNPVGVVTNRSQELPDALIKLQNIFYIENCTETDSLKLAEIREKTIDTDPLYVLFTSGSTGVPKGTVVTHRNVITYTNWVCNTFDITEKTVFGSQAPFYFSMSVTDVFSTIKSGAELVIIPSQYFAFPIKTLEFMAEHNVNTIYWVPSALRMVSAFKALELCKVQSLEKIMFAGETMPVSLLNLWRKNYPDAMFANLFGPTETTDICSYYIVDRELNDDESLPIGKNCNNCDIIVLNSDNKEAEAGEEGELCVRGSFVVPGYYNNREKTSAVFVQNPLNPYYPETVYRTGDIVKFNDKNELIYIGRKDFQIKHMGYRIELGEIEAAADSYENIGTVCCVYDSEKDKIILIYANRDISAADLMVHLEKKIPDYMMPEVIFAASEIPYTANGKIDRKFIAANYKEMKKQSRKEKQKNERHNY